MKGIPASPGIAIGRVLKLEEPVITIETKTVPDAEAEALRLKNAVEKSAQQILIIARTVREQGHAEEAEVFGAHQLMLEDPEWVGRIEAKILKEALNAEAAVDSVTAEFVAIFDAMDDDYLKARAADLKDVSGRLIRNLLGIVPVDLGALTEPVILTARDLTPSDTALLRQETILGFITALGNKTSHTAIIARTLGIPAVVGFAEALELPDGTLAALDGDTGEIWPLPTPEQQTLLEKKKAEQDTDRQALEALRGQPSQTLDGFEVELAGNIGKADNVKYVVEHDGEGIGLFRSEFLYMDREDAPTEEEQYQAYTSVVTAMGTKPVVIRTLDAGGDKHIPYINTGEEMNPFLGFRAIRICLADPALFRTQLRAILRASAHGNVKIMFPMIATLAEWRAAKAAVDAVKAELTLEGIPFDNALEIGIMVEIPSAAVLADLFAKEVDFFSIGTNDLTQYMLAADRMNERLDTLYSTFNPAVLRMIRQVIQAGNAAGKWVGMCGEAAGDLRMIPLLIAMGLEEFSMAPASILKARRLIRLLDRAALQPLLDEVMAMDDAQAIEARMEAILKTLSA
jgi:phosphotransferase system enzyme I (PtsI)